MRHTNHENRSFFLRSIFAGEKFLSLIFVVALAASIYAQQPPKISPAPFGTSPDNSVTYTVSDSVWPGDCNSDMVCNNFDILNIGLGFGNNGPARAQSGNLWAPAFCTDWNKFFASGVNYKHADCNGDASIDIIDTAAVYQNYGMTHLKAWMVPPYVLGNPNFYLEIAPDTFGVNKTLDINIMLGEVSQPIDSIYGIAFTIKFDTALVKSIDTLDFSNCWIGTVGTDLIAFYKSFYSNGYVDVALVRTNQADKSGFGHIGTFSIVTTDNLAGGKLQVSLVNVAAITKSETPVPLNVIGDSVVISGVGKIGEMNRKILLYPNPASGFITVKMPERTVSKITLYNMLGQALKTIVDPSPLAKIDVSSLPSGMYFMSLQTSEGFVTRKVEISNKK